jgi:hypothetical protein
MLNSVTLFPTFWGTYYRLVPSWGLHAQNLSWPGRLLASHQGRIPWQIPFLNGVFNGKLIYKWWIYVGLPLPRLITGGNISTAIFFKFQTVNSCWSQTKNNVTLNQMQSPLVNLVRLLHNLITPKHPKTQSLQFMANHFALSAPRRFEGNMIYIYLHDIPSGKQT